MKRATGGAQQPWVSSSPIDGNFYFSAPPVSNVGNDDAAQAWAATRDTTSIAVLDTFIQQYGNSIYAPFARAPSTVDPAAHGLAYSATRKMAKAGPLVSQRSGALEGPVDA